MTTTPEVRPTGSAALAELRTLGNSELLDPIGQTATAFSKRLDEMKAQGINTIQGGTKESQLFTRLTGLVQVARAEGFAAYPENRNTVEVAPKMLSALGSASMVLNDMSYQIPTGKLQIGRVENIVDALAQLDPAAWATPAASVAPVTTGSATGTAREQAIALLNTVPGLTKSQDKADAIGKAIGMVLPQVKSTAPDTSASAPALAAGSQTVSTSTGSSGSGAASASSQGQPSTGDAKGSSANGSGNANLPALEKTGHSGNCEPLSGSGTIDPVALDMLAAFRGPVPNQDLVALIAASNLPEATKNRLLDQAADVAKSLISVNVGDTVALKSAAGKLDALAQSMADAYGTSPSASPGNPVNMLATNLASGLA